MLIRAARAARWGPGAQPVATSRPPDHRSVRIEINGRSGFVNNPRFTLIMLTDRGVAARISNDRTFPEDKRTIRVPLTETATDVDASRKVLNPIARGGIQARTEEPCPTLRVCGAKSSFRSMTRIATKASP